MGFKELEVQNFDHLYLKNGKYFESSVEEKIMFLIYDTFSIFAFYRFLFRCICIYSSINFILQSVHTKTFTVNSLKYKRKNIHTIWKRWAMVIVIHKYRGIYPSIVNIRNAPSYLFQSDLYYYNEGCFAKLIFKL